jgi:hypothetical protein
VQQFKFDMFKLKICYLYFIIPIFGILTLLLIPAKEEKLLKLTALNFSMFSFIGSLFCGVFFKNLLVRFNL